MSIPLSHELVETLFVKGNQAAAIQGLWCLCKSMSSKVFQYEGKFGGSIQEHARLPKASTWPICTCRAQF